jgi:hypothetical protein
LCSSGATRAMPSVCLPCSNAAPLYISWRIVYVKGSSHDVSLYIVGRIHDAVCSSRFVVRACDTRERKLAGHTVHLLPLCDEHDAGYIWGPQATPSHSKRAGAEQWPNRLIVNGKVCFGESCSIFWCVNAHDGFFAAETRTTQAFVCT